MVWSRKSYWISHCDSSLLSQRVWLFSVTLQNCRHTVLNALSKLRLTKVPPHTKRNKSVQTLKKHSARQSAATHVLLPVDWILKRYTCNITSVMSSLCFLIGGSLFVDGYMHCYLIRPFPLKQRFNVKSVVAQPPLICLPVNCSWSSN
jgi:hypothetical protein